MHPSIANLNITNIFILIVSLFIAVILTDVIDHRILLHVKFEFAKRYKKLIYLVTFLVIAFIILTFLRGHINPFMDFRKTVPVF